MVRKEQNIAIAVASSGIAATLLAGGRTSHSVLKLPMTFAEGQTADEEMEMAFTESGKMMFFTATKKRVQLSRCPGQDDGEMKYQKNGRRPGEAVDVDTDASGLGIGRTAGIVPRIPDLSVLQIEPRHGSLRPHLPYQDPCSLHVVVDHSVVVVPEHKRRGLGAPRDLTRQIDGTPRLDVELRGFSDPCDWNCTHTHPLVERHLKIIPNVLLLNEKSKFILKRNNDYF
ncbi:hypothetical protein LAZ67_1003730 [Cordylochernes scorpioides]|uniref:ATP-dependent DNA helicase n=1 Tax=Cordylochernes scorpioides TaxID=51811 RepID=A0ABY6JX12_9ARAC|nr:hypothetical protein LAZ67_1003730 [Cordylochernes scorpioides]